MREISRRALLGYGLAGGATLVGAGSALAPTVATASHWNLPLEEATLARLQGLLATRRLTASRLTRYYLERIEELNPTLRAVIETNPDALAIARRRDEERRSGHVRGPLHGIPVIVKDNLATADRMETTAGSLALVGSEVPADAVVVARLRRAGAVILGKANLSEWANFRGFAPFNGWSARGGFTRNPYRLDLDPCGSSSGSATAPAANLCAVAIGTETDGSILCPSGEQSVVGIKPTVGLVSQRGIIPISASQDTAGPMCRTVTDAAHVLNVIRSPFGTVAGRPLPRDYTAFLRSGSLRGARLAYDHRYVEGDFGPGDDEVLAVADRALRALRAAGAVVEPITSADPTLPDEDGRIPFDDEFTVLLFEFKAQIASYLAGLRGTRLRTLSDLIAFNLAHCEEEMEYFGQEIFELAQETTGLGDPEYQAARRTSRRFGRRVIDRALARGYDAVVTPSYSFATAPAAMAGYPSMAVPVGYTTTGRPVGLWLAAGFLQEPRLLAIGYGIEQRLDARRQPRLRGAPPPEPPDAGICDPSGPRTRGPVGRPGLAWRRSRAL